MYVMDIYSVKQPQNIIVKSPKNLAFSKTCV